MVKICGGGKDSSESEGAMIACNDPCIYQQEGVCTLDHITGAEGTVSSSGCIHYVPREPGTSEKQEKI